MTQEKKDLLLADLCARLPYGVKVRGNYSYSDGDKIVDDIQTKVLDIYDIDWFINNIEIKPYLFPLSSMTLEQRCKVRDLLPDKCEISFTNSEISFYGEDYHKITLEQFEKLFHLFNMWHLDYRGLIPMGLALDATGLGVY